MEIPFEYVNWCVECNISVAECKDEEHRHDKWKRFVGLDDVTEQTKKLLATDYIKKSKLPTDEVIKLLQDASNEEFEWTKEWNKEVYEIIKKLKSLKEG